MTLAACEDAMMARHEAEADTASTTKPDTGCCASFSGCCGHEAAAAALAGFKEAPQPSLQGWLQSMLHTQFFTPCMAHPDLKKNEATHYCTDCGVSGQPLCQHCLPQHAGHQLIQIRRYVYCDVVRACDMSPYVDVMGIQTYIINQAKVIFLNHRPQTKMSKAGSPDACRTCHRSLREGCSYCSLACKIDALVAAGQLQLDASPARTPSDASDCYTSLCPKEGRQGMPQLGGAAQLLLPQLDTTEQQAWQQVGQGKAAKQSQAARRRASAIAHQQKLRYSAQARSLGLLQPLRVWGGRAGSDSDSDTKHSAGSSHCSRRKQLSPRRSPML